MKFVLLCLTVHLLFFNAQAQLAKVLEGDLFQPVIYGLVDICNNEKEDGLEVIKEVKKNWLHLLLVNKQVYQNMRKPLDEKKFDQSQAKEITNPVAQRFFNYCLEKIAPKMKYVDYTSLIPERAPESLKKKRKKEFEDAKQDHKILCAAHLAMPLALQYIENNTQEVKMPYDLCWILNPDHAGQMFLKILEKFPDKSQNLLKQIYVNKLEKKLQNPNIQLLEKSTIQIYLNAIYSNIKY